MIRDVYLHGALGERFGRCVSIDVDTPIDAVRALSYLLPGFRQAIRDGHYRIIRGAKRVANALAQDQLSMVLGRAKNLHIVPVAAGRGGRGVGKVLAGIALVGLAFVAPMALGVGMSASAIGVSGFMTFGQIAGIGIAMTVGGVAQMLTKPVPTDSVSSSTSQSYMFSGGLNVTTQGGPVPVVYGEFTVGSVLVSAGLEAIALGGPKTLGTLSDEHRLMALQGTRPPGLADDEWAHIQYEVWEAIFGM
ncbi:MAG: tail assembly protein [Methylacidiphilales bacterium]|nr:tail assembly protein [Candidatus Methylacidiphilales bacterium]